MIIVTGTKRSGTSMWMHVLVAAGLPYIGERFPAGWGELLREANPDGFFESELAAGINYRTNPHPLTGAYLSPQQTRQHAVKVFIPGLVRSDVAFIDRCLATVRSWRAYVVSTRRMQALAPEAIGRGGEEGFMPPALQWWVENFALVRDLAIRGYPIHVVSYDGFLRDPGRVASEALKWIGHGDASRAADAVRPELRRSDEGSASATDLAEGIEPRHLEVFDELHAAIDGEKPLSQSFVSKLNRTDVELRPKVLEHRADLDAQAIADIMGRR
jgi:hypothetical protein